MHEAILRREKKTFFKGPVRTPFHPIHRFVESHSVPFPRPRPSPILSLSTCSHCLFSGASDNPARIRENYSACLRTGKWKLSSVTYDDPFETPLIASRRIVCSCMASYGPFLLLSSSSGSSYPPPQNLRSSSTRFQLLE